MQRAASSLANKRRHFCQREDQPGRSEGCSSHRQAERQRLWNQQLSEFQKRFKAIFRGYSCRGPKLLPPRMSSADLGHGTFRSVGRGNRSWRRLRGQSLVKTQSAHAGSSRAKMRKTAFQWPAERKHNGKTYLSPPGI